VLTPGAANETKLGQLLDQAIGRGLIEVIGEARKDELKTNMAARLASGELAKDFFVGKLGVSFGTRDFDPFVGTIFVPYTELATAGLLAPHGKAKSAWQ
jgi:hypothetical protein